MTAEWQKRVGSSILGSYTSLVTRRAFPFWSSRENVERIAGMELESRVRYFD
jgi:hypothetical protein